MSNTIAVRIDQTYQDGRDVYDCVRGSWFLIKGDPTNAIKYVLAFCSEKPIALFKVDRWYNAPMQDRPTWRVSEGRDEDVDTKRWCFEGSEVKHDGKYPVEYLG